MTMAEATADKNTAAPPTGLRAASSLKGRLIQEQVAIIAAFTWTFQDLLGPLCAKVESAQKSSTGLAELLQARLIEPESIESHLLWNGNKSLSTGSGEDDFDDEDHEEFTRRFIVRLLKLSGRKVPSKYVFDHCKFFLLIYTHTRIHARTLACLTVNGIISYYCFCVMIV